MSIFNRKKMNLYLAIMASHLVVQGYFGFVALEKTTAAFAVVIQITGPPVDPTVGNQFPLFIEALRTFGVNFGLAWFVGLVIFD